MPGNYSLYLQVPKTEGKRISFILPIQQLPRLNTNLGGSEESLHLPIQHPTAPAIPPRYTSQIKRKPVPETGATLREEYQTRAGVTRRRSSDALGSLDPYYPSEHLKDSRDDLLTQKLVHGIFSANPTVANASQERIYGIQMRVEPDGEIRSPVSPNGTAQGGIYQKPADMSFLGRSLMDPKGRLQQVRSEQKLKRGNHVSRQPRAQLQEKIKAKAQGEFFVAKSIRLERVGLQHTQQRLNGRNEDGGYSEPLLSSREKEDSLADKFEAEYQARLNGDRRRLPAQKLKKPQHMVEGRTGFVQKATRYEGQEVVQEDFSGWYGPSSKRMRLWKKCKNSLAKVVRPKANSWQHI